MTSSGVMRSFFSRWIGDVAMKVWMRVFWASLMEAHAVSMSPGTIPASPGREVGRRARDVIDASSLLQPGHHGSQLGPHLLDLVGPGGLAQGVEVLRARIHLVDELLREGAAADVRQKLAHRLARRGADDALAAGQVAVLGGVGDRG